jgi:hypothetical protein
MTSSARFLPWVILAACAQAPETNQTSQACSRSSGRGADPASVHLDDAHGTGVQLNGPIWQLTKTGAVDAAASTVTWTITATQVGTVTGRLLVDGIAEVRNTGDLPATIGNVAVVLQRGPGWATVSADVADATHGDAATSIAVAAHATPEHVTSISENAASGALVLEDAATSAPIALVPEVQLPGGASRRILWSAEFDNTALGLAVGEEVRAELVVSFGNARPHGSSTANLDINGNGTIDADEAWVNGQSKPVTFTVPAATTTSSSPTIADDAGAITTTGTVTVTNPTFALGATSGTASVTFDPGAHGGTVTNCAQLAGAGTTTTFDGHTFPNGDGVSATACAPVTIPPPCVHGTAGCPWIAGEETTYDQGEWGNNPDPGTPAALLLSEFNTAFAATGGTLEVGIPGAAGFSIIFTDPSYILGELPTAGPQAALTADYVNPTTGIPTIVAGDVVALALDVGFDDAGLLPRTSPTHLGDLTVCGLSATPGLDGGSIRDVLGLANTLLGGGTGPYTIAEVDDLVVQINEAFVDGTVQPFADAHLVIGACP